MPVVWQCIYNCLNIDEMEKICGFVLFAFFARFDYKKRLISTANLRTAFCQISIEIVALDAAIFSPSFHFHIFLQVTHHIPYNAPYRYDCIVIGWVHCILMSADVRKDELYYVIFVNICNNRCVICLKFHFHSAGAFVYRAHSSP